MEKIEKESRNQEPMETLKEKLIKYLSENGRPVGTYRIKYFPVSPYQKRRYKPEFWQEECWIYPKEVLKSEPGICITSEDFEDKDYLKAVL